MSEKNIKARIVHKHDIEANWLKSSFIPKQGEMIVYDVDSTYSYERVKIGDGVTNVSSLPFIALNKVYVGPDEPTDPNILVWIDTTKDGTGKIPVMPRVSTITLQKDNWSGNSSPYYQTVNINTVTVDTKVELNPTVSQIVSLQNDDIALMAENNAGVVKVYSFGGKPSENMVMQVTLTEVQYV